MKIIVCMKAVPATTADIKVKDGAAVLSGVETIISPYDEYALEAALRLREASPGSTILAVSGGGPDAVKCLQHAFAVGADDALHVTYEGSTSPLQAAAALAAEIVAESADVVLCGKQAADDDSAVFPGALAAHLGMAFLSGVSTILPSADSFVASRKTDSGEQEVGFLLPIVLSCDKADFSPRSPTLKGRMEAKKKAIRTTVGAVPPAGFKESLRELPPKPPARMVSGAPSEAAAEIVKFLREVKAI